CPGPQDSVVHSMAMVSKQAPLTGPWHSVRHPWRAAKQVALPPRNAAAHCSKQAGSPVLALALHVCTHVFATLSTLPKHDMAFPVQPLAQRSRPIDAAGQLVVQ